MSKEKIRRPKAKLSEFAKIIKKKFIEIRLSNPSGYEVWLTVGAQSFPIGGSFSTKHETDWYASMLAKAIEKLITTEGDW